MDLVSVCRSNLLSKEVDRKEKNSFWASDVEKNGFDIYHNFKGTPPTNPFNFHSLWRFKCGELAEAGLVESLGDIVEKAGEDQLRVEFDWKDITISGRVDILLKSGVPCEVKSYYGEYGAKDLLAGKPKTNYLKQLAIYMYALKVDKGILYMVPMPAGEHYQFLLEQVATGLFRCNEIEFNIEEEFDRWQQLWVNHVVPGVEPKSDFRYKYPIDEINWKTISKSDISRARNGHIVLGDWQVKYSPYQDLIIEQEGTTKGYSLEELAMIKARTDGYSTWK